MPEPDSSNDEVFYEETSWHFPRGLNIFGEVSLEREIFKIKEVDETINNSDVYQDDNELFFSVGANELWVVSYMLFTLGDITADMKLQLTAPAGATIIGTTYSARTSDNVMAAQAVPATVGIATTYQRVSIEAAIKTVATPGTVALQWAQSVATVANTTIKLGSNLTARRM